MEGTNGGTDAESFVEMAHHHHQESEPERLEYAPIMEYGQTRPGPGSFFGGLFMVVGLCLVTVAAWSHDPTLGLAALGASLFFVGWSLG